MKIKRSLDIFFLLIARNKMEGILVLGSKFGPEIPIGRHSVSGTRQPRSDRTHEDSGWPRRVGSSLGAQRAGDVQHSPRAARQRVRQRLHVLSGIRRRDARESSSFLPFDPFVSLTLSLVHLFSSPTINRRFVFSTCVRDEGWFIVGGATSYVRNSDWTQAFENISKRPRWIFVLVNWIQRLAILFSLVFCSDFVILIVGDFVLSCVSFRLR